MRLSTRLVLLILVCLLPVMGAQAFSQIKLYRQRQGQLDNLALRQAELANGDLAGMVEGVRQFAVAVAQFPDIHRGGDACARTAGDLAARPASLPLPRGLRSVGATALRLVGGIDGRGRATRIAAPGRRGRDRPLQHQPGDRGRASCRSACASGNQDAGSPVIVVAGLDLQWLARRLDELRSGSTTRPGWPGASCS